MRTIIAGSRKITDPVVLRKAIADCGWIPTFVVSGAALGVDTLGTEWAKENGVPFKEYPVLREDWARLESSAGKVRNSLMASDAQALIAIWDGKSSGTKDMITKAHLKHLKVYVALVKPPSLL